MIKIYNILYADFNVDVDVEVLIYHTNLAFWYDTRHCNEPILMTRWPSGISYIRGEAQSVYVHST